jgi:hypothetical protein
MRMTASTDDTKILPSPILPVLALSAMAFTTASVCSAATAISSLILGTKST